MKKKEVQEMTDKESDELLQKIDKKGDKKNGKDAPQVILKLSKNIPEELAVIFIRFASIQKQI